MNALIAPKVSIVMLAYNAADTIIEAMDGALSQTIACEIIISDDASLDETYAIASNYAASYTGIHTLTLRRNASNLGLTKHFNTVLELSSGSVIVFMAGDDISYPERVAEIVQEFQNNANVYVVGSGWDEVDMQNQLIRHRNRNLPSKFSLQYLANAGRMATLVGATMAIRREVFHTFGPIQGMVEDNVMTLRGALLGGGSCLDGQLVRYRQNPNSLGKWLFARGDTSDDAFRKRYQRTSAMYLAIADDLEHCLQVLPLVKSNIRHAAEQIIKIYRLEAEARTAILDKPRMQWLSPIWRGLRQPGMRHKSLVRAIKLLVPKRLFGLKS